MILLGDGIRSTSSTELFKYKLWTVSGESGPHMCAQLFSHTAGGRLTERQHQEGRQAEPQTASGFCRAPKFPQTEGTTNELQPPVWSHCWISCSLTFTKEDSLQVSFSQLFLINWPLSLFKNLVQFSWGSPGSEAEQVIGQSLYFNTAYFPHLFLHHSYIFSTCEPYYMLVSIHPSSPLSAGRSLNRLTSNYLSLVLQLSGVKYHIICLFFPSDIFFNL